MIKKTLICAHNVNGQCTHPNAVTPSTGPDPLAPFNNNMEGGCRQAACTGYVSPSKYKVSAPIFKVEVAHTPLTVPSLGPDIVYYVFSGNTCSYSASEQRFPVSHRAVTNLLSEWYEKDDYPPVLYIDKNQGQKWAAMVTGWFMAQAAGVHTFYFNGDGLMELSVAGVSLGQVGVSDTDVAVTPALAPNLSSGIWYPFWFKYQQVNSLQGGYNVMFTYPGAPFKIPMSAGSCVGSGHTLTAGSLPVSWFEMKGAVDVTLDNEDKSAAVASIRVPLSASGAQFGYWYDDQLGYLRYAPSGYSNYYFRKDELVRVSFGYRTNGYDDLVVRFVGHVQDFSASIGKGDAVAEISCYDFSSITNQAINRNYPTKQTYWLADMSDDNYGLNGFKFGTPAFDAWPVDAVFRALMVHAGVDPTLLTKRYEFTNHSGTQILGLQGLVLSSGIGSFPVPRLERAIQYGNPDSAVTGGEPDSEYNFKYGFGEYITDILNEVCDNFGMKWGFRGYNNGAPYLVGFNYPYRYFLSSGFTYSGTWGAGYQGTLVDVDAIGGYYSLAVVSGSMASVNTSGTSFYVVGGTSSLSGSNHTRVRVTRWSGNTLVKDIYLNMSGSPRFYFDGVDPSLGYNPAIWPVATGLPYGYYNVSLESQVSGVMWNAVLVYERDDVTPAYNITTLAQSSNRMQYPGNIVSMSHADSTENMRNDLTIVGKSKGLELRATEFDGPKYYFVGRAIDVGSVFNPNSTNYIGRLRSGMITNSRIASDERASYIAYSALTRLRAPGRRVGVQVIADPLIEVHDCFNVIDGARNLSNGTRWCTSVQFSVGGDGFLSEIVSDDHQPYGSFVVRPDIVVAGSPVVANVSIRNRGVKALAMPQALVASGGTFRVHDLPLDYGVAIPIVPSRRPDPSRFVKYANVYTDPEMQSFVVSGFTSVTTTSCDLQVWSMVAPVWRESGGVAEIIIPYDPYYSEEGVFVDIVFDVLKRSRVRVDVYDMFTDTLVATLTGNPKSEHDSEKYWEILDVGGHKFSWSGFDQFGLYNAKTPADDYFWRLPGEGALKPPRRRTSSPNGYGQGRPADQMYVSEFAYNYVPGVSTDQYLRYGLFYVKVTTQDLFGGNSKHYSYRTKYIITRRGLSVMEMGNVFFKTDRFGYWATEPRDQHFGGHAGSDDWIKPGHFLDSDNSGKGLGIFLHWNYDGQPVRVSSDSCLYSPPRQFTYKVSVAYWRMTGMEIQQDPYFRVWGEINNQMPPIEGPLVSLMDRSRYGDSPLPAGFYGKHPTGTVYYHKAYFSPKRDHSLSYTQHAGALEPEFDVVTGGLEAWAWMCELDTYIQDLSGRHVHVKNFFTWFGTNDDGSSVGDQKTSGNVVLTRSFIDPFTGATLSSLYVSSGTSPWAITNEDKLTGVPVDFIKNNRGWWVRGDGYGHEEAGPIRGQAI